MNPFQPPTTKPLRILAIDPAAATGWCWSDGTNREYGAWALGGDGVRLAALETLLESTIDKLGCDLLAAEDAGFGSHNRNVQAMHNELRGIIKLVAQRRGIVPRLFNPGTIKKFATGNGGADKPQMIAACKTQLKIVTTDDNVADAIWICELARRPDCWVVPKREVKRRAKVRKKAEARLF